MVAELIQIYFKDEQKSSLYPFAIPYYNEHLSIYFENDPIQKLVQATKADKIAVCSWKLKDKIRMNVKRPRELTQEVLEGGYDVLSFTNNTKHHNFYAFGDAHHKGFLPTFQKMINAAGIKLPSKVKCPIYQNAFSAKREIYQDYVKSYLIPCMEVIQLDPEVNKIAMVDSNYSQLAKSSAATSEYLKEKIGVPFYPLVPFLLERLFSVYCQNRNINVSYL